MSAPVLGAEWREDGAWSCNAERFLGSRPCTAGVSSLTKIAAAMREAADIH